MAQRTKPDADKVQTTQPKRTVVQPPISVVLARPRKGKTRKGTTSRGTRRMTEIERRVTKALRRISRAADHGVDAYIDHRDKSAERRRDGVVVDFLENVSYGVSQTISEASPVLHDAAEALNTRRIRKQVRRIARGFATIPFIG